MTHGLCVPCIAAVIKVKKVYEYSFLAAWVIPAAIDRYTKKKLARVANFLYHLDKFLLKFTKIAWECYGIHQLFTETMNQQLCNIPLMFTWLELPVWRPLSGFLGMITNHHHGKHNLSIKISFSYLSSNTNREVLLIEAKGLFATCYLELLTTKF